MRRVRADRTRATRKCRRSAGTTGAHSACSVPSELPSSSGGDAGSPSLRQYRRAPSRMTKGTISSLLSPIVDHFPSTCHRGDAARRPDCARQRTMRRSVAPRSESPRFPRPSARPSVMSTTTISAIRATPVTVPLEAPIRHSNGAHWGRFVRTIVEVETADGYVGLGEMGGGGEDAARAFSALAGYLRGHDVFRLEAMRFAICNPTASLYNNRTQLHAAIEFACLDIIGQKLGVPVHDFLGASCATRWGSRATSSSATTTPSQEKGEVRTAEQLVAHARALRKEHGFRVHKLKGGVFPPAHELACYRALAAGASGRPLPLRPELRALACRRDRFRSGHRGPRERLLRRPRLGNAAARAPQGVRVDTRLRRTP